MSCRNKENFSVLHWTSRCHDVDDNENIKTTTLHVHHDTTSPPHFYCFPFTTTTLLLFSLHHHHISIVYTPPIVFLPDRPTQANLRPERSNSNNLSSRKTKGGVKTIEMWWWRENNRNVVAVVVVEEEGKQQKCGGDGGKQ